MKLLYHLWYRIGTPPWGRTPRAELVALVRSGRLTPGRVLELGCGTGTDSTYLAQHGFDVTGVDFAPAAIARARIAARDLSVTARFLVDDITRLDTVEGPFDLVVDSGTFDDLSTANRAACVRALSTRLRPGGQLFLWCFEWPMRWWERALTAVFPFAFCLAPGEVERWFGREHRVERLSAQAARTGWPRGWAAYLLTKHEHVDSAEAAR